DQAGNANYSAATQSTFIVTANKASQPISVPTRRSSDLTFNANFTVVASGGASGNSLTFASSGGCSNTAGAYTMTSGTTACGGTIDQAGKAEHQAGRESAFRLTAEKTNQKITVTTPAPAN